MASFVVTFDDGSTDTIDEENLTGSDSYGYADPVTVDGTAFLYRFTGYMWAMLRHIQASYVAFSTTSRTITNTGSLAFTLTQYRPLYTGIWARFEDANNSSNYMEGLITAYNADTGATTFAPKISGGSGTIADWKIFAMGQEGASPSTARAFPYAFSVSTSGDPGSGNLLVNDADFTAVTAIHASDTTAGGVNIEDILLTMDDSDSTVKGQLRISKRYDENSFADFDLSSISNQAGYVVFTVSYVGGSGTTIAAASDELVFSFVRTGDRGSPGTGDVNGPASSTGNALALWDGVGGDTLKNSPHTLDPSTGIMTLGGSAPGFVTTSNTDLEFTPDGTGQTVTKAARLTDSFQGDTAGEYKVTSHGTVTTNQSINKDSTADHAWTVNADIDITHNAPTSGYGYSRLHYVTQDGTTGGRTVTFKDSGGSEGTWIGDEPDWGARGPGAKDIVSVWYGADGVLYLAHVYGS